MEINARVLSVPFEPDSKSPMTLKVLEIPSEVVKKIVFPVFTPMVCANPTPKIIPSERLSNSLKLPSTIYFAVSKSLFSLTVSIPESEALVFETQFLIKTF